MKRIAISLLVIVAFTAHSSELSAQEKGDLITVTVFNNREDSKSSFIEIVYHDGKVELINMSEFSAKSSAPDFRVQTVLTLNKLRKSGYAYVGSHAMAPLFQATTYVLQKE